MKLGTRVSAFFLGALAVLLIGNSLLLFTVARTFLQRRFDEQLQSAFRTLVAVVEVEDDDVKWEATDHTLVLGPESGGADVCWTVLGDDDQIVAQSQDWPAEIDLRQFPVGSVTGKTAGPRWRILTASLAAPHPKPVAERSALEHARLTVVVARDRDDLQTTIRWLAVLLVTLPALCWLLAAVVGGWYVRQAIAPVTQMAHDVQQLGTGDLQRRLPVSATPDELSELAQAFNQLLDRVFTAYERQQQFAGAAAHQLRTPLAAIQGQVEVALRRERTAADYRQTLGTVLREIRSFHQTVETLLHLTRQTEDSALPEVDELDVPQWLEQTFPRWMEQWPGRELTLMADTGICRTSSKLLVQLLDTLIANAMQYSDGTVILKAQRMGGDWVFEVQDHGLGISAADQAAIFQPFYRAADARLKVASGTGLGLAIASQIAQALRAQLTCRSEPGQGSTFRLLLAGTASCRAEPVSAAGAVQPAV